MCGRFTIANPEQLKESFAEFEFPPKMPPRYNIAPTQPVAVVPNNSDGKVEHFTWGLIPHWAKDPAIGNKMINARSETLAEKPSFKNAYKRRRCLILADGFFEWRKDPGSKKKTPMWIHLKSGEPFAFAGLWEIWQDGQSGSEILSCTIITGPPNDFVADIHNRMPIILPREAYDDWLDPAERKPDSLQGLLQPYPAEAMTAHAVSTVVNNPQNDNPECIEPVS